MRQRKCPARSGSSGVGQQPTRAVSPRGPQLSEARPTPPAGSHSHFAYICTCVALFLKFSSECCTFGNVCDFHAVDEKIHS